MKDFKETLAKQYQDALEKQLRDNLQDELGVNVDGTQRNIGSNFDEFLDEEGIKDEVEEKAKERVADIKEEQARSFLKEDHGIEPDEMTLTQCDLEHRLGRVILRWGDVKDIKFFILSSLLRTFFPVDVHVMGDDAYCYMGFSPHFRPLSAKEARDMGNVPFYQLIQEDNGDIRVVEMDIKKDIIRKPTKAEIRKLG